MQDTVLMGFSLLSHGLMSMSGVGTAHGFY